MRERHTKMNGIREKKNTHIKALLFSLVQAFNFYSSISFLIVANPGGHVGQKVGKYVTPVLLKM